MPALSKQDPRYYVKQIPLYQIPSQKGIKIQCRSDKVYNPTIPTRDDVRKVNYNRRFKQINEQGFHAPNHVPYQGLGDPFYLDKKRLILHALGQWDENEDMISSSSSDSDDEEERTKQLQQQLENSKQFTATNFFVRRQRKDLNTLPKETNHGRQLIRNVRLGHGLFYMLRKEQQQKVLAEQQELQRQREKLRTECQPPKRDTDESDDEETVDEELHDDEDLKIYLPQEDGESLSVEKEVFITEVVPPSPDISITVETDTTAPPHTSHHYNNSDNVRASKVVFQGVETEESCVGSVESTGLTLATSSRPHSSKKKSKSPAPRPYTPQHSNINADIEHGLDKSALFRQLCALYWLLEAMNVDNPNVMAPISTCWSMNFYRFFIKWEIGGTKGFKDRKQEKEKLDSKWNSFVTRQNALKQLQFQTLKTATCFMRAVTRFRLKLKQPEQCDLANNGRRSSRLGKSSRKYGGYQYRGRGSANISRTTTPTGSQAQLNDSSTIANTPHIKVQPIPESSEKPLLPPQIETSHESDEEDDRHFTKGLFPLLDEFYSSMKKDDEDGVPNDRHSSAEVASSHSARSDRRSGKPRVINTTITSNPSSSLSGQKPEAEIPEFEDLTEQQFTTILESIERSYIDPRLHKLANPTERRTERTMRAETNVRPRNSAAVLEFKNSLPSATKQHLCRKMQQRFSEAYQGKALILHDTLEALERERFRKVQNKFTHLPTERNSFQRAVRMMRHRTVQEEENLRESQRKHSLYQQWFTDLDSNIPEHLKQDWYFNKILKKLEKYGLVEANKQSAYKFVLVLTGLRDWEICSPDISAAIEFCRERIVEMPVEDYEDWFMQQFPKVVRPQTAPPALRRSERQNKPEIEEPAKTAQQAIRSRSHVPQSAPPGGRKRLK